MAFTGGPRLPFAPLEVYVGRVEPGRRGGPPLVRIIAELSGFQVRTLHRWRLEGVPERAADELAVALGAHPSELWPESFA